MERGFCRFICPLGAGLAVIGKLRITDNLKRREECGSPCNLCSTSCPVNAIPSQGKDKGKIIMSECFRCLDCQLEYVDTKRCPPLVKIEKLKVKVA
jgi:polyferredoxin